MGVRDSAAGLGASAWIKLPRPGVDGPTEVTKETDPLHVVNGVKMLEVSNDACGKGKVLEQSNVEPGG